MNDTDVQAPNTDCKPKQGLWNVLMGHILDPRRVTGNFQKPTVIAYYQMGRE